eukprot:CCRYP_000529-RA/>CCRYP_000529-RA protein AED:0.40 eAED:0.40 QI:0/-1/0/1/-1/1/1/0/318
MFSADPSQLQHELSQALPAPYPPSIAISRTQARRLVESCELAEMSLASIGGEDTNISPYIVVIEMALLIRLGEYVHAHHLWERSRRRDASVAHSSAVSAAKQEESDDTTKREQSGEKRNDTTSVEESVHLQLELLWNAARYCYLWSTGGMYPFNDVGPSSMPNNMQVENNDNNCNLPYSTLALQALHSCASSQMQPLATYAVELIDIFRCRVNEGMHRSFGKIKIEEYRLRMNEEGDEIFRKNGWVEDSSCSEYLVPDSDWEPHSLDCDNDSATLVDAQFVPHFKHEDVMVHQLLSNGDRIRQLSNAVMFLEQTKMNT